AHAWTEVVALTCTLADAPLAMSPKEQARTCESTTPLIAHVPGPAYAGKMLQVTPAGSGSSRVTFFAVPVPAALLLLTVMVKPMSAPALTVPASATLVMPRFGGSTSTHSVVVLVCDVPR